MTSQRHLPHVFCVAFAICICVGCGDGRLGVQGTVTLDGQPVSSGTINFQPLKAETQTATGAAIENGRFTIPPEIGLQPGEYSCSVRAFMLTGRTVQDPQFGEIPESVEAGFRESGQLKATVSKDQREFTFALTSGQR